MSFSDEEWDDIFKNWSWSGEPDDNHFNRNTVDDDDGCDESPPVEKNRKERDPDVCPKCGGAGRIHRCACICTRCGHIIWGC